MTKITGNSPNLNDLVPDLTWHSTWKSVESYARYVEGLSSAKAWSTAGWRYGEDFHGTKTMKEALHLAQNGWKEGIDRIDKISKMISALNPILTKPISYGIAGATPNVPRAIAGNPLNMRQLDSAKSRRRPVITILSDMAESCVVSKDQITNKAATITAVIDRIEATGFSCEVIACCTSKREKYRCATSVMVKEGGQPLDVGRLSFGIGHSAMFRRLIFADWGSEATAQNGLGGGLGYAAGFGPSEELADKNVYVVPGGGMKNFIDEKTSAETGIKWILDCLKSQGCPALTNNRKFLYDKNKVDYDWDEDYED